MPKKKAPPKKSPPKKAPSFPKRGPSGRPAPPAMPPMVDPGLGPMVPPGGRPY